MSGKHGIDDDGLPKAPPGRALTPWKPGQSGNPSGRPKASLALKSRFRDALSVNPSDGKASIVDIVIALARGEQPPERSITRVRGAETFKEAARQADKQMEAIKIALAYGIGLPAKRMDDAEAKRIAEKMVTEMLDKARANLADNQDKPSYIDVQPSDPVVVSDRQSVGVTADPKPETKGYENGREDDNDPSDTD